MTDLLSLIEGLHVALAVTSLAIVAFYTPLTIHLVRERPGAEATQWIVAKVLMWSAQAVAFVPLAWNHVVQGIPPVVTPALPNGWRVASLAGALTAGSFFLAARSGSLWPRFFLWGALMSLIVGWVTST